MAIASRLATVLEGSAAVLAASGATAGAVLGRLLIGMVLAALAFGLVLRIKSRKSQRTADTDTRPSTMARLLTGSLAACEAALLVEATNLPVRFDQPGFDKGHWVLVLLVLLAAYFLQLPFITRRLKPRADPA